MASAQILQQRRRLQRGHEVIADRHNAHVIICNAQRTHKFFICRIADLCIRYDIQLGMVVLPKTANLEHMKTNADVDFVISDEDMELLKDVEKIESYGEHGFFPVFGGRL